MAQVFPVVLKIDARVRAQRGDTVTTLRHAVERGMPYVTNPDREDHGILTFSQEPQSDGTINLLLEVRGDSLEDATALALRKSNIALTRVANREREDDGILFFYLHDATPTPEAILSDEQIAEIDPALWESLCAILGEPRTRALLGDDGSNLTMTMNAAALRAFRHGRDDRHVEVLRAAFDLADRRRLGIDPIRVAAVDTTGLAEIVPVYYVRVPITQDTISATVIAVGECENDGSDDGLSGKPTDAIVFRSLGQGSYGEQGTFRVLVNDGRLGAFCDRLRQAGVLAASEPEENPHPYKQRLRAMSDEELRDEVVRLWPENQASRSMAERFRASTAARAYVQRLADAGHPAPATEEDFKALLEDLRGGSLPTIR